MHIINFSDEDFDIKPQKKLYAKYRLKSLLVFIVVFAFILGFILLFRGYFGVNPPVNDLKIYSYIQNANEPKSLTVVNTQNSQTLGENIASPFTKLESDTEVFIKVKTEQNFYIGYLSKDNISNWLYKLPSDIEDIKLFQDNSLLYFVNNRRGEVPRLVYVNNSENIIKELEFGEYFVSSYFDSVNKAFYYSYIDINDNFILKAIKGSTDLDIYTSSASLKESEIIHIENDNFFLQEDNACYNFNLINKAIQLIDCKIFKRNDRGVLFSSNSSFIVSYPSSFKGQISKYNVTTQLESVFLERPLVNISKVFFFNDNLLFLQDSINTTTLMKENTTLQRVNLMNSEETLLASVLPAGIIDAAFFNNTPYLLTKVGAQYNIVYLSQSGIVSSPQNDWIKIGLGIGEVVQIEFLRQDYIYSP
jgi:hypothetical protein